MTPADNAIDILLVDDSATDAELTLRALKHEGVEGRVFLVRDGEAALNYLFRQGAFARRKDADPRMILLDLKLPKLGGLDVIQKVKADDRFKSIPIVVLTSSTEPSDVAESYARGANSFVIKPVEFDRFIGVVSGLAHYWTSVNHLGSD